LVTEEQSLPLEEALTYYEQTKIQAEEKVREAVRTRDVDVVIVNPTRLYGPGPIRASNAVTRLILGYLKGTWRVLPGNGKSKGNYVHTEDMIQGMTQAMAHGRKGERYLLGGSNMDLSELFGKVGEVTGIQRWLIPIPTPFLIMTAWCMQGWAAITGHPPLITSGWVRKYLLNDWAADSSKARKELGYGPRPAEEGIRETYEWLVENGQLEKRTREGSKGIEGSS
jgi:farnesol dehydrogenase